jgi:hypothetical protein
MKKGVYLFLAMGLVLGLAGSVNAQAVKKGALTEEKKAVFLQQGQNLIQKLGVVLAKEQDLGIRLNSRIQKLEAEGLDMTASKAKIAEAQTTWQEAATVVTGLQAEFEKVASSTNAKTAFAATKKSVKTTATDIKSVHKMILDIIKLIKDAKPSVTASTTPATE